ncbi:MAG: SpoIID/LytB domain-containing protein, partial [Candidatus Omnitrophica bacterium]|nr:SpoIID/LytB domain-containing protein [Candidatus Omnitrophota bacterium]
MLGYWSIQKKIGILSLFFLLARFSGGEEIRACLKEGESLARVKAAFTPGLRGNVYICRQENRWFLINALELEDYVTGVVGNEMGKEWPIEALKAQAVCARSVALYRKNEARRKGKPYDVMMSHQIYGRCEHDNVITAVEETRGEILTVEGKPALVFYHTCCGGATTNPDNVWPSLSWPYLLPVSGCHCDNSLYTNWERIFWRERLSRILNLRIQEIAINEKETSGRVITLTITTADGDRLRMKAADFRNRINQRAQSSSFSDPTTLPGTIFTLKRDKDRFIFTGRGYGHGVGLCQWGARRMAEQGAN